ncbi:MAG: hypothetical protein IKK33_07050 [Lachnospiraceae bacterium]|nr:hypothetical protein [Lachnospiraceae bacterium]
MKKNLKDVVVKVAGVVGFAVLCMVAYYGLSMFLLQNGVQNMTSMLCPVVAVACACIAIGAEGKQKAKETTGVDV